MLKNFVKLFGGDPNKKVVEQYSGMAREINDLEPEFEALTDDALRAKTDEFRAHVAELVGNVEGLEEKELFKLQQDALEEILPEAFAAVREASKRTLGQRHYDVQMIGGVALHRGSIAEMRTGEGKTLVASVAASSNGVYTYNGVLSGSITATVTDTAGTGLPDVLFFTYPATV